MISRLLDDIEKNFRGTAPAPLTRLPVSQKLPVQNRPKLVDTPKPVAARVSDQLPLANDTPPGAQTLGGGTPAPSQVQVIEPVNADTPVSDLPTMSPRLAQQAGIQQALSTRAGIGAGLDQNLMLVLGVGLLMVVLRS